MDNNFDAMDMRKRDMSGDFSGASMKNAKLMGMDLRKIKLSEADLTGADLSGADLTGAILIKANLTGADLSEAILIKANLTDSNLSRTFLIDINLYYAVLIRADLTNANLISVNLIRANLYRANLTNVDLEGSDLTEAYLAEAILTESNLDMTHFTDANLTYANLTRAILTQADLTKADLYRAILIKANLTGANLSQANLSQANLTDANLINTDLTDANLTGAYLIGADLTGADLTNANLTNANLTNANLTGADLTNANLTGAYLIGVNLTGVTGISDEYTKALNAVVPCSITTCIRTDIDISTFKIFDAVSLEHTTIQKYLSGPENWGYIVFIILKDGIPDKGWGSSIYAIEQQGQNVVECTSKYKGVPRLNQVTWDTWYSKIFLDGNVGIPSCLNLLRDSVTKGHRVFILSDLKKLEYTSDVKNVFITNNNGYATNIYRQNINLLSAHYCGEGTDLNVYTKICTALLVEQCDFKTEIIKETINEMMERKYQTDDIEEDVDTVVDKVTQGFAGQNPPIMCVVTAETRTEIKRMLKTIKPLQYK